MKNVDYDTVVTIAKSLRVNADIVRFILIYNYRLTD